MKPKGGKREGAGRKPRLGVKLVPLQIYVAPGVKIKLMDHCKAIGKTPGDLLAGLFGN